MAWRQFRLHRFDPNTDQFTVYSHKSDDPHSLSDNRVVAIYFDRAGSMWVGTQNGLDKLDPRTRTFAVYSERNGMGGNVVSCILEDQRGLLWMSTNKGVSSFDPRTQKFSNYTMADGLPGPDLTGWGACFKSAAGEMFFGGFSGVTAFFPDQVVADAVVANAFVPPIVLTDFRLFGRPVTLSPGSPLKKAVNYTDTITLSHSQNIFSIGFSALSFFNPATNRYRYMLEGLDQKWNEVGSDQRLVIGPGFNVRRLVTGKSSWQRNSRPMSWHSDDRASPKKFCRTSDQEICKSIIRLAAIE